MKALLLSILALIADAYVSCKDDNGKDVDYWWAIKEPEGTKYIVHSNNGFVLSGHSMNDTSMGVLAKTAAQAWTSNNGFMMFNDEPPGSTDYNFSYGHTKGVWIWNDDGSALVLTHSVPLFPVGPGDAHTYKGLGSNAYKYAQHVVCLTVSVDDLEGIAPHAMLTAPQIYDSRLTSSTPAALRSLVSGAVSHDATCTSYNLSVGGLSVTYFAKSAEWNNGLYSACIGPQLGTNLLVESWVHGSAQGPYCGSPYTVLDISALNFNDAFGFKEGVDHSKWAVGDTVACASDINRMTTQFKRGGGAFCLADARLVGDLKAAVVGTDSCPS